MEYNHFSYGEQLAKQLKVVSHTSEKPRFFTAFGLEDLYSLNDKLSSVTGTILIAVDGCESTSEGNVADSLSDEMTYSFIVACNTNADRPETINQAAANCRQIAKQIRNRLFHDPVLKHTISRNTSINGIGPIGDNFYGVALFFTLQVSEEFFIDHSYWH